MEPIDYRMSIEDLLRKRPKVKAVLLEMGIDCSDCIASQVETLLDVVRMYDLDLEKLLERIHTLETTT